MKTKSRVCILVVLLLLTFSNPALAQHLDQEEILPAVIGILVFLGFAVLIILFIFGISKATKKAAEEREKYYHRFALSHGFGFHEQDTFNLAQELEETPFKKRNSDPDNFLKNILTHSDHNSDCYVFYRYISSGKENNTGQAYTLCFFKIKKDFGLELKLKARSPLVFGKVASSLLGDNLKEVRIPASEDFNKKFVVYTDKEAIATTLIGKKIIEYCITNKKEFIAPEMVYTEIKNNKLIIYVQHRGFTKSFKDQSQLEKFVNFARELKEKLAENM